MDPFTGSECRLESSGAAHKLGTLTGSEKPCKPEVVLQDKSFSEEVTFCVILMVSTSTESFDLSCPIVWSKTPPGESGALFAELCFSMSKSSCIVVIVALVELTVNGLLMGRQLLENRFVSPKSPIKCRISGFFHGRLRVYMKSGHLC